MRSLPFTVQRSLSIRRYPFTAICSQWLVANSKCTVNSKWLMVNGSKGAG